MDRVRTATLLKILKRLTNKLRGAKDVFKIVAKIDLVCQAEVDELNAWVRHAPVQQHDVFRLGRDRKNRKDRSSPSNDNEISERGIEKDKTQQKGTQLKKTKQRRACKTKDQEEPHGNPMQNYRNICSKAKHYPGLVN